MTIGPGTVSTDPNYGEDPTGIVGAASVGRIGAAGQTMTVTDDDLEDLVFAVDEAYRLSPSCGWMMHEQTLRSIAKLKGPAGSPLQLVERGADLFAAAEGLPGHDQQRHTDHGAGYEVDPVRRLQHVRDT